MRYRYLVDFWPGISVFVIFSYGIAVLGTPQCPPPTRAKLYHGKPPHFLQVQRNPDQFHKALGTQVLTDILLLAKCDHFLHIESSVAALASYGWYSRKGRTLSGLWRMFITGFVQGLVLLKKSWNLPCNFSNPEKVWEMVKSLQVFFKATTSGLDVILNRFGQILFNLTRF